jgi:hypothetical protein
MGLAEQPFNKQQERVTQLFHPITILFNHRILDQIQYLHQVGNILLISPGSLCVPGLMSTCDRVKDVGLLAKTAEIFFDAMLCSPVQLPNTTQLEPIKPHEALIAWEELRFAMKFPETDEAGFLVAATSSHSFLVLIDYLAQRRALGEVWNTVPSATGEIFSPLCAHFCCSINQSID